MLWAAPAADGSNFKDPTQTSQSAVYRESRSAGVLLVIGARSGIAQEWWRGGVLWSLPARVRQLWAELVANIVAWPVLPLLPSAGPRHARPWLSSLCHAMPCYAMLCLTR
jgi:hypothetical protein